MEITTSGTCKIILLGQASSAKVRELRGWALGFEKIEPFLRLQDLRLKREGASVQRFEGWALHVLGPGNYHVTTVGS